MLTRRFLFLAAKNRPLSTSASSNARKSFQFVIVGGGAGGLSMAASLCRTFGKGKTAVIEPSEVHYFQPRWTLIGGGIRKDFDESQARTRDVMPALTSWYKTGASEFRPDDNLVICDDGTELSYEYLIVAVGLRNRFDLVKGLPEALHTPGVGSNFSSETVLDTWKSIQNFKGGNAIFTQPNTRIKCPGAPQEIMYIAEEQFGKMGIRHKSTVMFNSALDVIFGVEKYAELLTRIAKSRDMKVNFLHNLVEVNADTREAIFEVLDGSDRENKKYETFKYDLLHVCPPMSGPACLDGSPISDKDGYVDVNQETLQHKVYKNVFAVGDCTNLPTGKTAAAVGVQCGILKKNLMSLIKGKPLAEIYNGYSSCPLVTGYGKLILAEYDFTCNPLETFPFDQGKERMSMYFLKQDILPQVYWHGLIKGLWPGASVARKVLHLGLAK